MIIGAHSIIYSSKPEEDRTFFRVVLGLPHVDVGEGWLIFGLPPSEVAVHDAEASGKQELYLMCRDVEAFVEEMAQRDIETEPVEDQGWGLLTHVTLPGGGKLGVYQPRHARPEAPNPTRPPRNAGKKKAAPKRAAPLKAARRPMKVNKAAPPSKKKKAGKKKGRR